MFFSIAYSRVPVVLGSAAHKRKHVSQSNCIANERTQLYLISRRASRQTRPASVLSTKNGAQIARCPTKGPRDASCRRGSAVDQDGRRPSPLWA